ncbi:hypothetical protein R3I93_016914 [Phoxinus phoxinus]|uniref:Immunoglobulin domain-containing protein n=1 Tax=Phoxinus phoxinus TaxID=58324 RepID=A0AAN9CI39_9TELE
MLGIFLTLCVLHGVFGVETDRVTGKEGGSITLPTNVQIIQKDRIKWFFQDTRIAQVIGNISSCTDVQCKDGDERFRDRLKLDPQTGSLTISDIQHADSGLYELQITSSISNTDSLKSFNVTIRGAAGVFVSVMEGDSVTLNTGVQTNQRDRIRWYFNDTQIAQINGDLSKICTDVQCNEGTERFRDRLKLDLQTGSLNITNITNTHSGVYHLQINSRNSEKTFNLAVHGVPAGERDEVKTVKEEESVTLDPDVIKNTNDLITWHFNDILIAEFSGDQRKICEDVQCKERFRDRLKLDHQTLTVTNTRTTDSGRYTLRIIISSSSSFSIRRIRSLSVTVTGSGRNPAARAGILGLVVAAAAAAVAAMIYIARVKQQGKWCMLVQLSD